MFTVCSSGQRFRRSSVRKPISHTSKSAFQRADNQNIAENEAFILSDPDTRALYEKAYADSGALYYKDKPTFEQILSAIKASIKSL